MKNGYKVQEQRYTGRSRRMMDIPLVVFKQYQNVPTVQITGFTEEQKVSFLSPWV